LHYLAVMQGVKRRNNPASHKDFGLLRKRSQ
jgi:hypothetical protein